ncbi:hypothetical protein GCM10025874_21400 [Arenivirga flava]|uniref:Uncharacterized protein n=1 Tax=Arenivirga flava TaxID=1930060 RepID=A0AA37ULY5_9MICO|nr:hypothetical protein GCM10025874_21400 [Arenivirga flava]
MQLAWSSPQLEGSCSSSARLRVFAGDQAVAAEDLLSVVAQAPRLGDLAGFRSVRMSFTAGKLTLAVEEVDMHAQALSSAGSPRTITSKTSVSEHADAESLVVHDLLIRGRSILRRAS